MSVEKKTTSIGIALFWFQPGWQRVVTAETKAGQLPHVSAEVWRIRAKLPAGQLAHVLRPLASCISAYAKLAQVLPAQIASHLFLEKLWLESVASKNPRVPTGNSIPLHGQPLFSNEPNFVPFYLWQRPLTEDI